ncbi:MAG: LAGLIDADG family homing endonuclease [Candidatus Uhrbacteria bacterium]|nr:LAGLIDADG family homing endonuclease [Candidatus Uhrbacteria bacterium]
MGKPKGKVKIEWSPNFAYAIGLIVADGSLSNDRRHIDFTSKDLELINHFKNALNIQNKVGTKARGSETEKRYYRVQIGDVLFYRFLEKIGLMPNKSKILSSMRVPDEFFFDFLRGHLDGDGHFYSYWDKRWKSSFMFYIAFNSASKNHIDWLRKTIKRHLKISGHITKAESQSVYQLKYAKAETLTLLPVLYYSSDVLCLTRKREKIENVLT